jgi:hypothetical protein
MNVIKSRACHDAYRSDRCSELAATQTLHQLSSYTSTTVPWLILPSTMSGLSSFLTFRSLGTSSPRERSGENRLRSALETMPGSRKHVFTPNTRADILSELYDAFWGPYSYLFLANSNSSLPLHKMLSEVQVAQKFSGAGSEDPPIAGRPCSRIFKKGESCFRCKCVVYFKKPYPL